MKKPKVPKVAPAAPEATPEVAPETAETEARKIKRQQGFERQVLTGALTPQTQKKTVLG